MHLKDMHLSTFTDYSLRLLLYLAEAPERRATVAEVAAAYDISRNHLTKIVHMLGKAGILANTRGRRGGVRLAQPAGQINLGRVVRVTEGDDFPLKCGECGLRSGCGLIRPVREAVDSFYAVLDRYTLADLAASSSVYSSLLSRSPASRRPSPAIRTMRSP